MKQHQSRGNISDSHKLEMIALSSETIYNYLEIE